MPDKAYVTKTGRVLTDADLEALADEAERGYDVAGLAPSSSIRPAQYEVVAVRMTRELAETVRARAESEMTSVSELVREALRVWLNTD